MPSSTTRGSGVPSRKRQVPCQECRQSHVKCDKLEPRCRRCAQLGLDCHLPLRVRLTPGDYNNSQKWLKVPKKLSFVDESTDIASEYVLLGEEKQDSPPNLLSYPLRPSPKLQHQQIVHHCEIQDHSSNDESSDSSPPGLTMEYQDSSAVDRDRTHSNGDVVDEIFDELINFEVPPEAAAILDQSVFENSEDMMVIKSPMAAALQGFASKSEEISQDLMNIPYSMDSFELLPNPSLSGISYPAMNGIEAQLFRHYTQTVAACLDGGDPMKRFELIVPERALTCTALLKAIFAIAARHLCETTHHDPLLATRYHQESIRQLVSMMAASPSPSSSHSSSLSCSGTDLGSEENIFATSIILRMLEEMSGDDSNDEYLRRIHRSLKVRDLRKARGSLGAASYWVGVRQEIYSAVMSQSPVKAADLDSADRSFEPADDFTWSTRAVVLLADTLNFCFGAGGGGVGAKEIWQELHDRCVMWEDSRPASFEPYFMNDEVTEGVFPEKWFYSSCHIIGVQNHTLAKLFLLRFDPSIPRVGPTRNAMTAVSDRQIMHFVKQLCGVGTCNHWAGPAMHAASMGIAMFGDIFNDKTTQEAMLDILRKTELIHGRPTRKTQYQLMTAWGWTAI